MDMAEAGGGDWRLGAGWRAAARSVGTWDDGKLWSPGRLASRWFVGEWAEAIESLSSAIKEGHCSNQLLLELAAKSQLAQCR